MLAHLLFGCCNVFPVFARVCSLLVKDLDLQELSRKDIYNRFNGQN